MRVVEYALKDDGTETASELAAGLRGRQKRDEGIVETVSEIIERVRRDGDKALVELALELDSYQLNTSSIQVEPSTIEGAVSEVDRSILDSLKLAIANVERVARSQLGPEFFEAELEQGQKVTQSVKAVRRAGIYVPGGRAPYPSTVVMCAVPARVAGVKKIALCTPACGDGKIDPLVLAACSLTGIDEVYRVGGAQAIAAMAFGTETVPAVDVITGPGNAYVQEAKRQLYGYVGIDGIAGPSELMVIADGSCDATPLALDLLAQAEHASDSFLVIAGPNAEQLDRVCKTAIELAKTRQTVTEVELIKVRTTSIERAIELAEELAPEHLQLACEDAQEIAKGISRSGCVFLGQNGATAFGDYVAGSNHVLPTGSAARFTSSLGPAVFQRRQSCVSLTDGAARALAPHVGRLARAEGLPVHAESAEARIEK